jgi:predicted DNA binding CopG/RHH family protein
MHCEQSEVSFAETCTRNALPRDYLILEVMANMDEELSNIVTAQNLQERVAAFDKLCLDYLTDTDRAKLRTSLRKHRQRLHKRGNAVQVSLSVSAFELLKKVASRENLNYSQVLEKYLWNAVKTARRRKP